MISIRVRSSVFFLRSIVIYSDFFPLKNASAIREAIQTYGRTNVYFCVFTENQAILHAMDLIPRENIFPIRQTNMVVDGIPKENFPLYLEELEFRYNSYYFPDNIYTTLQGDISHVNSFRIVFNKVLKTNFNSGKQRLFFNLEPSL